MTSQSDHFIQNLTPLQLAESFHHKAGFVWLDSSLPNLSPHHSFNQGEEIAQGLSILAYEPDLVLEGKADEWHLLEKELLRRQRSTLHPGFPEGAAIGFFRYDGSFRFSFYERLYLHHTSSVESRWLTPLPKTILKTKAPLPTTLPPTAREPLHFQSNLSPEEYRKMVRQAQEFIAAGDIYQVCLAHRFQCPFHGDPWPLYLSLRKKSPAPFAAYLQSDEETILSSSPECFLKMSGQHIMTRPIKGTRPRRNNIEEDELQALELKTSPKEIAELVMITDMERNDLGKICNYGSVVTSQLLHLERYPQVFHLVSTVEGELRPEISHVAALKSCFPGGSISGAPKRRAMEIIKELEPIQRGLFTGAIGYFGFNGESQFSIAIRTLVISSTMAEFYVGAGITSDSLPNDEWEETLHKASGILQAAQLATSP